MFKLSGDISKVVFRRAIDDQLNEVSLNTRLLSILLDMDGKRNLSTIAKSQQIDLSDLKTAVSRLLDLNLIEQVKDENTVLDDEFIHFLMLHLAKAIGPLSQLIVEDTIHTAGYSLKRYPADRAGDLVDTLARDIQRTEKRLQFKKDLQSMMRQKGYNQRTSRQLP
jgi:hypothetical protein